MALSRFGGALPDRPSAGPGLGTQPAGFSAGCRALNVTLPWTLNANIYMYSVKCLADYSGTQAFITSPCLQTQAVLV